MTDQEGKGMPQPIPDSRQDKGESMLKLQCVRSKPEDKTLARIPFLVFFRKGRYISCSCRSDESASDQVAAVSDKFPFIHPFQFLYQL